MNNLVDIINALTALFQAVDNKTAIIIIFIVVIYLWLKSYLDSNKQRYYYNQMVQEKNKEIERLADDNRRYREIYLPQVGLSEKELSKISAGNVKLNAKK